MKHVTMKGVVIGVVAAVSCSDTGSGRSNDGVVVADAGLGGDGSPARDAGSNGGSAGAPGGSSGSGGAPDAGPLAECSAATPLPEDRTPCRDDSDCSTFSRCGRPGETPQGAAGSSFGCSEVQATCVLDSDCAAGEVCITVVDERTGCQTSVQCQPACTATSCAADEACDPNGHCFPKLCTAGFSCGEGFICDLSRGDADAHGCVIALCASDAYACPAGSHCADPSLPVCGGYAAYGGCMGDGRDAHGCVPDLCTEGYVCPENHDCVGAQPGWPYPAIPHGCARRSCSSDSQCDCGACIAGVCEDEMFVCSEPIRTPYLDGTSGFVELSAGNNYFGVYSQFFLDLMGAVGGESAAVDTCRVRSLDGYASSPGSWTTVDSLVLVDEGREIPIELFDGGTGFYSYGVDLTPLGIAPRFGGTYAVRGGGGPYGDPIDVTLRLPEALSVTNLDQVLLVPRAALSLTWTGTGTAPLYIYLSVRDHLADSWWPYDIECMVEDDGAFEIPAEIMESVPEGLADAYFTREARDVVTTGSRSLQTIARVEAKYGFALGERCDRPEVLTACALYVEQLGSLYAQCGVSPAPLLSDYCPAYLGESCAACPEYFECMMSATQCMPDGLYTTSPGCACPVP